MRGNLFRSKLFLPHEPSCHVRSSPTVRMRIRATMCIMDIFFLERRVKPLSGLKIIYDKAFSSLVLAGLNVVHRVDFYASK